MQRSRCETMDKQEFQQALTLVTLHGIVSNPYIAEQIAVLDRTTIEKINSAAILAEVAIKIAEETMKRLPKTE